MSAAPETKAKAKLSWSVVWREAGVLVAAHRNRLLLGLGLLVIGRAASLVLPGSAGWLIDQSQTVRSSTGPRSPGSSGISCQPM